MEANDLESAFKGWEEDEAQLETTGKVDLFQVKESNNRGGNTYKPGGPKNDSRNPYANAPPLPKPKLSDATGEVVTYLINRTGGSEITADLLPEADENERIVAWMHIASIRAKELGYKLTRTQFGNRIQFESEETLLRLLNDEAFLRAKIDEFNTTPKGHNRLNEYTNLMAYRGILGEELIQKIYSTKDTVEKKATMIIGLRKIFARNFGKTKAVLEVMEEFERLPVYTLLEMFTRKQKFILAVWKSKAKPRWNPLRTPEIDYSNVKWDNTKRNPYEKKAMEETPKQPPKNQQNTPMDEKAIFEPITTMTISPTFVESMDEEAAKKFYTEKLGIYVREYYPTGADKLIESFKTKSAFVLRSYIYHRGMLRNYAKTLKIPPKDIVILSPDKSMRNPVVRDKEFSYLIQCTRSNAGEKPSREYYMVLMGALFEMVNGLNFDLRAQPLHKAVKSPSLHNVEEIEKIEDLADKGYMSLGQAVPFKNGLRFEFRLATKIDLLYILGKSNDYNVKPPKTLATFLKENQFRLTIESVDEVDPKHIASFAYSSEFDVHEEVKTELVKAMLEYSNVEFEPAKLHLKWIKLQKGKRHCKILSLYADENIADELSSAIMKINSDGRYQLTSQPYPTIYDYMVCNHNPSWGEDQTEAAVTQQKCFIANRLVRVVRHVEVDLTKYTPSETALGKKNEENLTLHQLLTSADEPLLQFEGRDRPSPIAKLLPHGSSSYIALGFITDEIYFEYYLSECIGNDISKLTGGKIPLGEISSETLSIEGADQPSDTESTTSGDSEEANDPSQEQETATPNPSKEATSDIPQDSTHQTEEKSQSKETSEGTTKGPRIQDGTNDLAPTRLENNPKFTNHDPPPYENPFFTKEGIPKYHHLQHIPPSTTAGTQNSTGYSSLTSSNRYGMFGNVDLAYQPTVGFSPFGGASTRDLMLPTQDNALLNQGDVLRLLNAVKDQANAIFRAAIAEQLNPQHPASGFMDLLNKRDQEMLLMIKQLVADQVQTAVKEAFKEHVTLNTVSLTDRPPSCPPQIHQSAQRGGDATLQSAQRGEVVEEGEGGTDHVQALQDNETTPGTNQDNLGTPAKQNNEALSNQTPLSEYKGDLKTLGDDILNKIDDELVSVQDLDNSENTTLRDDPRNDPEVDEWEKRDEDDDPSNKPTPQDENNTLDHQQDSNEETRSSDEEKTCIQNTSSEEEDGGTPWAERTRRGRSQAAETTASKSVTSPNEPINTNTSSESFKSTRKK